jgi:hypothetical protein
MKSLLIEHIPYHQSKLALVEGKVNGPITLVGKLQEAEQKNGNGRVYRRDILEREIDKYKNSSIKSRTSLGELDHPDSSVINLSNSSHLITEVWWEGNDVMGKLELLDTPSGNIALALVKRGIPLGISSRGMGSVKQIGETVEVQDDFELLCWDLVSVPSTPQAYFRLSEGKTYNDIDKYQKINKTITEILCNLTGVCPVC